MKNATVGLNINPTNSRFKFLFPKNAELYQYAGKQGTEALRAKIVQLIRDDNEGVLQWLGVQVNMNTDEGRDEIVKYIENRLVDAIGIQQ